MDKMGKNMDKIKNDHLKDSDTDSTGVITAKGVARGEILATPQLTHRLLIELLGERSDVMQELRALTESAGDILAFPDSVEYMSSLRSAYKDALVVAGDTTSN